MAKFLTTNGNSYYIEQIIVNAQNSITLVTPYLNLGNILVDRLKDADKNGIKITLVYGKDELKVKEKKILYSLNNVEIYFCKDLHAKCYHNEEMMIVSSMNLYEFSEKNNREMGILIEKKVDDEIFADVLKEIDSIKNASRKEKEHSLISSTHQENKVKDDTVLLEKVIDSNDFVLDPKYNKPRNFHLKSLKHLLESKYPSSKIILDYELVIEDFPKKGIKVMVDSGINFLFENRGNYLILKNKKQQEFQNLFPNIRFYWNFRTLNIYMEKDFVPSIDNEGLKSTVIKYFTIIDTIKDRMK